jgi:hypothetical protein
MIMNDEVRFVLDQHAEMDFDSASSLKKQSAGRHVAPLGHINLIPSQPVFALYVKCVSLHSYITQPGVTLRPSELYYILRLLHYYL